MNPSDQFAFPNPAHHAVHNGMTLRDYFAGQVLAGIATVTNVDLGTKLDAAKMCYAFADAMLEARFK